MIDNPKAFMTIAIAFILSLTVIIYSTKSFISEQNESSNFDISINSKSDSGTDSSTNKGTSVSKNTGSGVVTPTKTFPTNTITPNAKADYTVYYRNGGFSPANLTIRAGQSVRFLNESSHSMFIAAARSPNANDLTEFNQGRSVGKGGYYDFTFHSKGVFVYYNQNDKTKTGVIAVE